MIEGPVVVSRKGEVRVLRGHPWIFRTDVARAQGITPGLAVVLVGDDPASRAYVRSKDKMCRELGLHSVKLELPAELVGKLRSIRHYSGIPIDARFVTDELVAAEKGERN